MQGLFLKGLSDKFLKKFLKIIIPDGKEPTRFGRLQTTKSYFSVLGHEG